MKKLTNRRIILLIYEVWILLLGIVLITLCLFVLESPYNILFSGIGFFVTLLISECVYVDLKPRKDGKKEI